MPNLKCLLMLVIMFQWGKIRCQNERSYDTNDWIPITPSGLESKEESSQKRATGRVLNIESPSQKFFPDDEYLYRKRRPQPQQQHQIDKIRYKVPNKYETEYKFEVPLPPKQQPQSLQYFPNQKVQLQSFEKPPPPPRPLTRVRAPPPNAASIYEQYNLPVNRSYYEAFDPTIINRELLRNNPQQFPPVPVAPGIPEKTEKDSVQLVYVPLENLKPNQPVPQNSQSVYQTVESPVNVQQQHRLQNIEQDFIAQALQAHKLQQQIQLGQPLILQTTTTTTTTTAKPAKKRKPHQPPLAVYMEGDNSADISEVLNVLKDAKTIAVQDSIQPDSPQIFIGPSTLDPPEGYSKYPLPYLNSIDGNRINPKIDKLPFFVAPVSYKAPAGYSKILLPSPHVGSVVVSQKENGNDKRAAKKGPTTFRPNLIFESTSPASADHQDYYSVGLSTQQQQQPQSVQYVLNNNNIKQVNALNEPYGSVDLETYKSQVQNYHPTNVKSKETAQLQSNHPNTDSGNVLLNDYPTGSGHQEIKQSLPPKIQQELFKPHVDGNEEVLLTYYPTEAPEKVQIPKQRIPIRSRQQIPESSYRSSTTINQPNQEIQSQYRTPSKTTKQYQSSEDVYNIPPRTTPSTRYVSDPSVVSITPRTTTPNAVMTNYYVASSETPQAVPNLNPLDLAINEFELHQINTQLEERPQPHLQTEETKEDFELPQSKKPQEIYQFDPQLHRFANTPTTILRDAYETTTRPTKSRRRGSKPPKTTTPAPETYTVLEEYAAKSTEKYTDNSKNRYLPLGKESLTGVYTIQTTTEPHTTTQNKPSTKYQNVRTEVEMVPARVYSLDIQQPVYNEHSSVGTTLNQQQVLQQTSPRYEPTNFGGQYYSQFSDDIAPLVHNRGQNVEFRPQPQEVYNNNNNKENYQSNTPDDHFSSNLNQEQDEMSDIVKSLQEQSVRSLFAPNLLAPVGKDTASSVNSIEFTTPSSTTSSTTTTTERLPETTTTKPRNRGRTRGGSRYSHPASTTRRTVTRRRPTHPSRTTTTEYEDYQRSSTRQRFRTRGRTTPSVASDKISTTENEVGVYNGPTSEVVPDFQKKPKEIQVHPQYVPDHNSEAEPGDYYKVFPSSTPTSVIHYENTGSTYKPYISETTEKQPIQRVSSGDYDDVRPNFRTRGRTRVRTRPTHPPPSPTTEAYTTRRIATTAIPKLQAEKQEEEYYGFIRTPNFNQVASATQQPQFYSNSFQQNDFNQDQRLNFDNTNPEATTIKFVGEIRPKYPTTTTQQSEVSTETPKPRIRARIKIPQRKSTESTPSNHRPTYQEVNEQAGRRISVNRSRGKAHFQVPENLRSKSDEEADVEGGNYPANFPQVKTSSSTAAPSFQITIEPHGHEVVEEDEDDDQSPNSSLYRPRVVLPDEWHDASEAVEDDEGYASDNKLNEEDELITLTTTEIPFALPFKNASEENQTGVEAFMENTQAMENLFETVNNFEKNITSTEKAPEGRRRGVWKLVKLRPVDPFETAESQNYQTVLNVFDEIKKVPASVKEEHPKNVKLQEEESSIILTTTVKSNDVITTIKSAEESPKTETPTPLESNPSFLDSFYQMFNMPFHETPTVESNITNETKEEITTTIAAPTFPEEITEELTTTPKILTELPKIEVPKKHYEVEPWKMKQVRTSTSTEVSHETEICYKGRCIKSKENNEKS